MRCCCLTFEGVMLGLDMVGRWLGEYMICDRLIVTNSQVIVKVR
jgi:hypothetical protein